MTWTEAELEPPGGGTTARAPSEELKKVVCGPAAWLGRPGRLQTSPSSSVCIVWPQNLKHRVPGYLLPTRSFLVRLGDRQFQGRT